MITHAVPFSVTANGIKITAYRYRKIDETRSAHNDKATMRRAAVKRRRRN